MFKKIILVLFLAVLFLGAKTARAGVIINEFISFPNSGEKEWVELLNTANVPQDLTGWKLTELSSPDLNPVENSLLQLSGTLPANGVLVFDVGSIKLNNDGDSIGLYDGMNLINRITYGTNNTVKNYSIDLTASEQGKSSAFVSNTWKSNQIPTKGEINPESQSGDLNSSNNGTTSTIDTKPKVIEIHKIQTKITANTLAYVGIPFDLEANTFGYSGELLRYGKYYWNFDDGDSKEINVNQNQKFTHTYYYPGEYEITLEYYSNYYSLISETINKFTVKVIPATIYISKVGDEKDFFIELSNNSDYNIDISKWVIVSLNKIFVLPKNTEIGAKDKMILSPKITNFSIEDKNSLKLLTSMGEIAFEFNSPKVNKVIQKMPTNSTSQNTIANESKNENSIQNNSEISVFDLSASSVLSNIDKDKNSKKSYFFFWAFVLLLMISGGVVYYIRQNKNISKVGDDFKIIDE